MFDLLNAIESLSEISSQQEINNYLKDKIKDKNIFINKLLVLGKTYRTCGLWEQKTYIGIINEIWFFYLETENNNCQNIILDKNCDIIFDIFYGRELIKSEKDYYIKEMKCLLLYDKLQTKMLSRYKEKTRKI